MVNALPLTLPLPLTLSLFPSPSDSLSDSPPLSPSPSPSLSLQDTIARFLDQGERAAKQWSTVATDFMYPNLEKEALRVFQSLSAECGVVSW